MSNIMNILIKTSFAVKINLKIEIKNAFSLENDFFMLINVVNSVRQVCIT